MREAHNIFGQTADFEPEISLVVQISVFLMFPIETVLWTPYMY
jgi:hypothetical protein